MRKGSPISVDTARTLAHVALLAAVEGHGGAAECILGGLHAILPPLEPNVQVCRAMVCAMQDRIAEASAILSDVLAVHPNHVAAKGLLGLFRFATGETGWQQLFEEVLSQGSDNAYARLARQILSEHCEY